jgi:hypothetical protein
MKVIGPDGSQWEVRRRWQKQPKWRGGSDIPDLDVLDIASIADFDVGGVVLVILAVLVFTVVGAAVIIFLLPALFFVVEFLILAAAAFLIYRRWVVEAHCPATGIRQEWTVRGWRRARRAQREVADELRQGLAAEPDRALAS